MDESQLDFHEDCEDREFVDTLQHISEETQLKELQAKRWLLGRYLAIRQTLAGCRLPPDPDDDFFWISVGFTFLVILAGALACGQGLVSGMRLVH